MTEGPATAEDALAEALHSTGARHAFGVPGGGANLDLVGAFVRHGIDFVLGHSETATCIAAATYGYVSDTVSAAVVTRGPGAASAVNGAAEATLDRHPLVLVSDTVASSQRKRIAHQRIDQHDMFAPVTKATADLTIGNADAAVRLAASAPRGAVHLDQEPGATSTTLDPGPAPGPSGAEAFEAATELLTGADHPVVIVGVGAPPTAMLAATLATFGAPVLTTYQAVGIVPTGSSIDAGLFTGGTPERRLLGQADLVVLVGLDMVEPIPASWPGDAPVISIGAKPTLETYAPITVELLGDIDEITARYLTTDHLWPARTAAGHRATASAELRAHGCDGFGPVELVDVVADWARPMTDLTTTVDAGAHFLAIMPLWQVARPRRLLISNGLATMGYAVPAAIGAALARPGEPVLALTGDGGLGMCLAELETIGRLDLPITVVVFNDAELSLIRIKQQDGQGGSAAVRYRPTDFAAVAEAQGILGFGATTAAEVATALRTESARPRLIDVRIDPEAYQHLIRTTRS